MPAISPCEYELITIESDQGVTIDLRLGMVSFQYYEDLFSPTITAKMVIISTSGVVSDDKTNKIESLYNGLPIRGGERVAVRIKGNSNSMVETGVGASTLALFLSAYLFKKKLYSFDHNPDKISLIRSVINEAICTPLNIKISDYWLMERKKIIKNLNIIFATAKGKIRKNSKQIRRNITK